MCLMSPQEFIAKEFSKESAPHEHTVRRWIDNGQLPGRRVGNPLLRGLHGLPGERRSTGREGVAG